MLLAINFIILLTVLFSEYKSITAAIGIVFLVGSSIIGRLIQKDESKIINFSLGNIKIEILGVESIIISIIGLYSMLQLTESVDLIWVYFLVFNISLISQVYFKIYRES